MIDTHLSKLKIVPESDLNLQNITSGLELQRINKKLTTTVYILIGSGLLILTYYLIKNEQNRNNEEN
jgi:hypothetical protein